MALDIVRLVDIRLDQRDDTDARIATDHVEHRHPATARTHLEQMNHFDDSLVGAASRAAPDSVRLESLTYFASGRGHSPVSCQIS